MTNSFETQIVNGLDNIDVVTKENASRYDYQGIIVVDLSSIQTELAQEIAEFLDGQVESLPSGENRPNADILVIIGSEPGSTEEPTTEPSLTP